MYVVANHSNTQYAVYFANGPSAHPTKTAEVSKFYIAINLNREEAIKVMKSLNEVSHLSPDGYLVKYTEDGITQTLRNEDGTIKLFDFDEAHSTALYIQDADYSRTFVGVYNAVKCRFVYQFNRPEELIDITPEEEEKGEESAAAVKRKKAASKKAPARKTKKTVKDLEAAIKELEWDLDYWKRTAAEFQEKLRKIEEK